MKLARNRWLQLAIVFALLVLIDARYFHVTRIVDQRGGDLLLALNTQARPESDRVVIIDIDQRSLEMMNDLAGSWPWPRSVHGELIDHVMRQKPRGMAFDILFNERDVYRPEHDAMLTDAVARHPNVWLAIVLNADGPGAWVSKMPPVIGATPTTRPPKDARIPLMMPLVVADQPQAMRGGLINFTADSDGVGRHHRLYRDRSGWRFASMPARMMRDMGRPVPSEEQVMLNWRSGWKHVSFADIYLDSLRAKPQRLQDEFKDKIVLVGTAAPGLMDLRLTPLGSTYPGVQILATAIDNLDRGDWLREVPRAWTTPLALALIALIAVALARGISALQLGYVMLGITVIAVGLTATMLINGIFVPIFGALAFGWLFYLTGSAIDYFRERRKRLRTSIMFKRFLDPRVVNDLIERGDIDYRASAESREVSVLFSDIRGFTAMSEQARAEDVVALLNDYFSEQVQVIFRHGGTLDKFIGDAIMAFWGAPVASENHAEQAIAAALDMSKALENLRGRLGALGAELEIGIGIHSGRAVAGFIGSNDRLDYTVIGDTVNLASRIEGLTKGNARILVSEATRDAALDAFAWRDCGSHSVKGREAPVQLFEPTPKPDA